MPRSRPPLLRLVSTALMPELLLFFLMAALFQCGSARADGIITTIAGDGAAGFSGDGGHALYAQIDGPSGVVVDNIGNIYIADFGSNRVRRIAPNGTISTVAGNGGSQLGDGGPASAASLDMPEGIALDAAGNLYIADSANHRVRKVGRDGLISTVAGTGTAGFSGDGGPAVSAQLYWPAAVVVDHAGNLFISDWGNDCVRRVDAATQQISTVAGNLSGGYSGDGGAATGAQLLGPVGLAFDAADNLFIADQGNHVIRRVDALTQKIATVAGTGSPGFNGDRISALNSELYSPSGIAVDGTGNLYIADEGNNLIRWVDPSNGVMRILAGTAALGFGGDGGPATAASLAGPYAVAVGTNGDILLADTLNNRIRKFSFSPTYTLFAGPEGSGGGTVTSADGFIHCPTNCTHDYAPGTVVTLTATPAPGYLFSGWAGECSGYGACTVTIDPARGSLSAAYALFFRAPDTGRNLTAAITGSGQVTSADGFIDCGTACSHLYPDDATVTLTATAADGWIFAGWSGGCTGTAACVVTLTADVAVQAQFRSLATAHTLEVSVSGDGSGTVSTSDGTLSCPTVCAAPFPAGARVTLTASPAPGSLFSGWGGACSGTGTCSVLMNSDVRVLALFSPATGAKSFVLSVSVSPASLGTVTSGDGFIECGDSCSRIYAEGAQVRLSAQPARGAVFVGWAGPCSTRTADTQKDSGVYVTLPRGDCYVRLTDSLLVTAIFAQEGTTLPPIQQTATLYPAMIDGCIPRLSWYGWDARIARALADALHAPVTEIGVDDFGVLSVDYGGTIIQLMGADCSVPADDRPDGIYPNHDGTYDIVSNGRRFRARPGFTDIGEFMNAAKALNLWSFRIRDDGTVVAVLYFQQVYVFRPSFLSTPTGERGPRIGTDPDGRYYFLDSSGRKQEFAPAFFNWEGLVAVAQSLGATLDVTADGTVQVVLGGRNYLLIPDYTLGALPAAHAADAFWEEGGRYFLNNGDGSMQGVTLQPQ